MKTSVVEGKSIKAGDKFLEIEGNKISFLQVSNVTTSKPGKHGAAKNNVTAVNLKTGTNFFKIVNCSSQVLKIDSFEAFYKPIYMINNDFTEFTVDLETEEVLTIFDFSAEDKKAIEEFFAQFKGQSPDSVIEREDGTRLCMVISKYILNDNEVTFFCKFDYVPEAEFNRTNISVFIPER